MATVVYWKLSYRADVAGYPMLDVMFSDEKYAINSLKKFWGEEYDTLIMKEPSANHKEWYKEKEWGIRNLMATLDRVEVTPYARSTTLEGTRPVYEMFKEIA